jgi:hypothetical protein
MAAPRLQTRVNCIHHAGRNLQAGKAASGEPRGEGGTQPRPGGMTGVMQGACPRGHLTGRPDVDRFPVFFVYSKNQKHSERVAAGTHVA